MKKFNPDKELKSVQQRGVELTNYSGCKNLFLPFFVLACFCVTMFGTSFAGNFEEDEDFYVVRISILNGNESEYVKKVKAGDFSTSIDSSATFSNFKCTSGNLNYNSDDGIVSGSVYEDTSCVLVFKDDGVSDISLDNTVAIHDMEGVSYYFKGDSDNNYVKIKDVLFRIVRRNGDGTYRLILNNNIDSMLMKNNEYVSSPIFSYLEKWVENFEDYVVLNYYDCSDYNDLMVSSSLISSTFSYKNVGLLGVQEAILVNDDVSASYLDGSYYLANKNGNQVWSMQRKDIVSVAPDVVLGIRPVINVSIDKVSGSGTEELPYLLQ